MLLRFFAHQYKIISVTYHQNACAVESVLTFWDKWLTQQYPHIGFVRYADDIVLHCASKEESERILSGVKVRLEEIKLGMNEEKSRIVYCKDYRRREDQENVQFGFLGFSFQPRKGQSRR